MRVISTFWQRLFIVLTGTALAQIVPFVTMPFVTRMLAPKELGPYLVWMSIVSIITVFVSLRLDMAIFNADTVSKMRLILQASCVFGIIIIIIFLIASVAVNQQFNSLVKYLNLEKWRTEAILMAFIYSVCMVFQNAYLYGAFFHRLAGSRIAQSVAIAVSQLFAINMGWGVPGIIFTQIGLTLIVALILVWDVCRKYDLRIFELKSRELMGALVENWRFPIFSMPADLISLFAGQLPTFVLAARFGMESAAQYALMNKVLGVPIRLLSNSVLSVFKEEAGRFYRETGNCEEVFITTFKRLILLGLVPFVILFLVSDVIFFRYFGSEWKDAGIYYKILAPMFYLQFISSPLSYVLYISNRQAGDLIWQVLVMVMTLAAFYLSNSVLSAMKIYAAGYSALYICYLIFSYIASRGAPLSEQKIGEKSKHPK
jgi:O-antigen/teichoic acid export membrane protein